ncbi:MAG: [protein-PII] uridylyltransferase [Comamonas sp.]|nr:[protein-PII] uridylyltransferase [Comamonas sp.]
MHTHLAQLRTHYEQKKAQLLSHLHHPGGPPIRQLLHRLALLVDAQLVALRQATALPSDVAIVAVGGYGRSQLFPYSDVDVLLLVPGESSAVCTELRPALERFVGACWDAGLEIGSSVCTVAECLTLASQDITAQTSMLDARLIDGSAACFQALMRALPSTLQPQEFFLAKHLELRQRHTKFENTPYALEPNCKEAPGGLRDLQTIVWVAMASGLGRNWQELAQQHIITPLEAQQLERNETTLFQIRARLHAMAGRHEDRLLFDLQTAVAHSLGVQSHELPGQAQPVRASEVLMRRYYWAAKAVMQLQQIVLLNIQERLHPSLAAPLVINDWFADKNGLLEVRDDTLFQRQPQAILHTFLTLQTHPGLRDASARTLRALYNARDSMNAQWRRDPVNRATFVRILQQPSGITHALRLMNATSVLGRYLWSFRRIVGKMQHDLFHVYTVDQHSLMVLRNMRRFFMPEFAHEYPLCSELASQWEQPWLLYLAALFHDIGKGRGGDHSTIGAIEVRRFAHQHGLARADAELAEFLVREHLRMSTVAQKQDTNDPAVVRAFADAVGTPQRLTGLYLLTVADIRGTSPKVWSAWKGKLLQDLYHAALRMLGGHSLHGEALTQARQRQAQILLSQAGLPADSARLLWNTLEAGYFLRHEPADIAWHARQLYLHVGSPVPIVRARPSLAGEGVQVLVYAPDGNDLFARICGYFDRMGLSILHARIYTSPHGHALDTFQVQATHLGIEERELSTLIEAGLPGALAADSPLPEPARRQPSRRARCFPMAPHVSLQPDEKAQRWLLHISATDRAGLLYSVARVLARYGLSVQLAKVMTLGERVEDSFLLEGPQLQHTARQLELEKELVHMLQVDAS